MHDVFLVTSEGSDGGHIVRTVTAADQTTRAKHTRKTTPTRPSWRFTNEPSRFISSPYGKRSKFNARPLHSDQHRR
jgi:hypothetical protein